MSTHSIRFFDFGDTFGGKLPLQQSVFLREPMKSICVGFYESLEKETFSFHSAANAA